eukprot:GHRQ01028165.1.p3 GENE.GHRQ01028165.1~~GHRQ01028165.1.p3  ORF type:complete len:133 (-),score=10.09 GHRQ01028165.1:678-1076(-)
MLGADSSRAFYGPGHVLAAAELGAVQTLLISGDWLALSQVGSHAYVRHVPQLQRQHGELAKTQLALSACTCMPKSCQLGQADLLGSVHSSAASAGWGPPCPAKRFVQANSHRRCLASLAYPTIRPSRAVDHQ